MTFSRLLCVYCENLRFSINYVISVIWFVSGKLDDSVLGKVDQNLRFVFVYLKFDKEEILGEKF